MSRTRETVVVPTPRKGAPKRSSDVVAAVRPRGVGEILDTAFDVFAVRFAACLGLAALLWFPFRLAELILLETAGPWFEGAVIAAPLAVEFLIVAFVARLVREELQGGHLGAFQAMTGGLLRAPGLIVIGLTTGMLTFATWLCCWCSGGVVPLLVTWLFSVAAPVYVLERVTMPEAMVRSTRLVRHSFPRFVGWYLLARIMVIPISGFTALTDSAEAQAWMRANLPLGTASNAFVSAAVTALFLGLASAYSAVAMTVYYVDTRTRSEGFDLRLRLERLVRRREELAA